MRIKSRSQTQFYLVFLQRLFCWNNSAWFSFFIGTNSFLAWLNLPFYVYIKDLPKTMDGKWSSGAIIVAKFSHTKKRWLTVTWITKELETEAVWSNYFQKKFIRCRSKKHNSLSNIKIIVCQVCENHFQLREYWAQKKSLWARRITRKTFSRLMWYWG